MNKGKLITFYGINNIGKSTHAKKVVERLNSCGIKVKYLKYPIYDLEPTGPKINHVLRKESVQSITEQELQTLFMQNRKDFEFELKKMLDDGFIVIAEDYTGTGIAWGTAKGLDRKWVEELNEDLLKEDFTIMLEGKRRMFAKEENHIHESNDELVKKVDQILHSLAEERGWEIVTVQPDPQDTAKLVWEKMKIFLGIRD